jgi:hypothetical protein
MKRWMLFGLVAATLTAVGCGRGYVGVYARTAPPPVLVETYWARAEPGRYLDQWILGIRDQQLRLDSGTLGSLSARASALGRWPLGAPRRPFVGMTAAGANTDEAGRLRLARTWARRPGRSRAKC